MDMGFPFGVKKMFWNEIMVMDIPLWEYTKNHCIVHFKRRSFVACKLYLNKKTQLYLMGGCDVQTR